ncbi:hypothetical protein C8K61_106257 [Pseudomonas sp. GV071]|jgi:hypothetical protein|nr:hypothetical protein C8K61_106257 [Pseudomonas sp. GV071]
MTSTEIGLLMVSVIIVFGAVSFYWDHIKQRK